MGCRSLEVTSYSGEMPDDRGLWEMDIGVMILQYGVRIMEIADPEIKTEKDTEKTIRV